jgi:hypothetical protein
MAISKLPLSPFRQDTKIFPTPLSSDVLFSELRDCTRTEIPAYGTAHPDSKKWPDHKLVFVKQVEADQREGLFEFYYAADRANQDLYNFSTGFASIGGRAGDRNYRIITRVYVTPRSEYDPVDIPFGTAMPDVPKGMFEKDEYIFFDKEQQKTNQPELDSLYIIEAHRYIERSLLDDIPSFEKERPDVIPERFRATYPTLRTDRIVEGQAEEPTLDADDLAVTEKQINPDVKLVTNISRDELADTITLTGSQAYVENSTVASVTETLTSSNETETGLYVVQSRSTPLGDGKFVVETVKVDSWPELRRSEWDPLLNTPVVTKQTFVAPPSDTDIQTPFTSFSPINEDRYLKVTEETPAAGLANYKFSFPSRINLDLPPVLKSVGVLWSIDSSGGRATTSFTGDDVGENKISVSRGSSTDTSGSAGASPEFFIEIQRIWGRDIKADNVVFFIDKSTEDLSRVSFTEEEIRQEVQRRFFKPSILEFNAEPSTIINGNSTVLKWDTRGASSVTLNGSPVNSVGSLTVSPTTSTNYELVLTNSNGSTKKAINVAVVESADSTLISKFDVNKSYVQSGDDVVLEWATTIAGVRFNTPTAIVVDSNNNFFVADSANHVIRKSTGFTDTVTTFAGTAGQTGTTNGTGASARFTTPKFLTIDSSDNIYVADSGSAIRKITPAGVVTTLAGDPKETGTTDGTGSAARFGSYISGIAAADNGDIYVADYYNHSIRKITSAGVVTTFAGLSGTSGTAEGTLANARFTYPEGIVVGSGANPTIYVAENRRIRKIEYSGGAYSVTTLAGQAGVWGLDDGTGASARFYFFRGMAINKSNGDLYVTSQFNNIRKITSAGVVTSPYGNLREPQTTDGTGLNMRFYAPHGLFFKNISGDDRLVICDTYNHSIRYINTSTGTSFSIAGTPTGPPPPTIKDMWGSYQIQNSDRQFAGYSDGTGSDTFEIKIEAPDDAGFLFFSKSEQSDPLFSVVPYRPQKNYWLKKQGTLRVAVYKTTDFKLHVRKGGVRETRTLRVSVTDEQDSDSYTLLPWPVFKTSSGRAVGVSKSVSGRTTKGEQKTDAVTEDSIYASVSRSQSFSYSVDTRISVSEISNVLTNGVSFQSTKSVSPTSQIVGLSAANSATTTHKPSSVASNVRAQAVCGVPRSSPTDIPRVGLYLIDYKIEYYKWGWFRCAATVVDARQLA